MAEHKHGSMNTKSQEATFAGFIAFAKWTSILIAFVLVFLALTNA